MPTRARLKAPLAIILGTVAALAIAEAGLRIAAALVSSTRARAVRRVTNDSAPHVVFVGDSHTFGLGVGPVSALPGVVESVAATDAPPGLHSYNYGRSGATSWTILSDARDAITNIHPDALVVRIGVNNSWATDPEGASVFEGLRIVRLGRLLLANWRDAPKSSPEEKWDVGMRWDEIESGAGASRPADGSGLLVERLDRVNHNASPGWALVPSLERDLRTIASWLPDPKTQLFIVGYLDPVVEFAVVNDALRDIARRLGVTFVDMAALGTRAASFGPRKIFFLDGHPKKLGYAIEGRELVRVLIERGVLKGTVPADPIDWLRDEIARQESLERARPVQILWESDGAGGCRLAVLAKPNSTGQILLGNPGKWWRLERYLVPIDRDSTNRSKALADTNFSTDANGRATVELPRRVVEELGPRAVALAIVKIPENGVERLWASSLLEVGTGAQPEEQPALDEKDDPKNPRAR